MADIDTSTYPKAQPYDPLKTLGGVANLQNTLNQNKLFQQQFNTNLAVSEGAKASINPETGEYDPAAFRAWIAKNPNAGYGIGQIVQQSQEAQKRNIDIDTSRLENQRKHWDAVGSFITPLLAPKQVKDPVTGQMKPVPVTSADVLTQLSAANSAGIASSDEMGRVWATLPRTPDGRIDESQVPAWTQKMMLNLMDRKAALDATNPVPSMQEIPGGGKAPFSMSAFGGVQQVGDTIQPAPVPTTTTVGPDGTPRYIGNPQGNNPYEAAYQASQGRSAPAGGGIAPGGNIGGLPSALSPAAAAAQTKAGDFAAGQGNSLQARADQVPTTKSILGNLEAELDTPGFSTGPGTKSMADLTKFLNTQGGLNIRTEGMAAREQFGKLAGMLAQSQFQALGGTGTDAKLDATTLTSPNSELTKLGNKGIIAMLKGNEDAIAAKNRAWQAWQQQNGPQSYGQFSTQFNKSYDPRVFQAQYLSDADKKKMLSSMSQKEINALVHSANFARQNGWIQ